jgi:ribosomal protein L20
MNRKNIILTMLACLNCTHTTHAVEKSEDIQQADQDNGQESLDKLKEQCKLQTLRLYVGMETGNPDRDAAIQREEIMQKLYAHKKDALLPDNPLWSLYESLTNIKRDIAKDLRTLQPDDSEGFAWTGLDTMFNNKIKELVDSGKMKGIKVKALYDIDKDLDLLCWDIIRNAPRLSGLFDVNEVQYIKGYMPYYQDVQLTKYPDIEKKRRGVYRKLWVHDLNSGIKNEDQWIGNIGAGLQQLNKSNTEIGRDMLGTVVITLRNNLLGTDKDLKERTIALLQQDPVLKRMIWSGPKMKKMLTDSKLRSMRRMEHFKKNANFANARGLEKLLVKRPLVTDYIAKVVM